MLTWFIPYKNIIPEDYVSSIFDIDYNKLYSEGKRLILTDLDNTLISYKEDSPNEELFKWKNMVEDIGFEVIIVSNSHNKRVKYFANQLNLPYVNLALKPLKFGFKKALRKASRKYKIEEVVELGDQLLTDVYGSKRMKFYTILVKAIDKKTERAVTRFNRKNERKMLAKCRKKNYGLYLLKLKKYEDDNLWLDIVKAAGLNYKL